MMKFPSFQARHWAAALLLMVNPLAAATLWQADFEGATLGDVKSAPTGITFTLLDAASAPAGSSGGVMQIQRHATGSEYTEVRASGGTNGTFLVSTVTQPMIGDAFALNFDVYVPDNTVANGLTVVVRLRASSAENPAQNAYKDFAMSFPALSTFNAGIYGTWQHVTIADMIPATFVHQSITYTTYNVTPIIAWRQTDYSVTGMFGYLDNISFSVNAVPEPTRALLVSLGSVLLLTNRRRKV
jgi:hypothetical protein